MTASASPPPGSGGAPTPVSPALRPWVGMSFPTPAEAAGKFARVLPDEKKEIHPSRISTPPNHSGLFSVGFHDSGENEYEKES